MMDDAVLHERIDIKVLPGIDQCLLRMDTGMSSFHRLFGMVVIQEEVMQQSAFCCTDIVQPGFLAHAVGIPGNVDAVLISVAENVMLIGGKLPEFRMVCNVVDNLIELFSVVHLSPCQRGHYSFHDLFNQCKTVNLCYFT